MTSRALLFTLTFGVIAMLGLFLLVHDGITGNAARRTPYYVTEAPYCPNGCAYGNVMTLKTADGYASFSANDLAFECYEPEKTRCHPENSILYATAFKGEPTHGILVCENHVWKFSTGLIPPCPPKLVLP
jgi:hypothetical protein